jgi:hypothetical protein
MPQDAELPSFAVLCNHGDGGIFTAALEVLRRERRSKNRLFNVHVP